MQRLYIYTVFYIEEDLLFRFIWRFEDYLKEFYVNMSRFSTGILKG